MGKSQLSKKLEPEFVRLGFKFKNISEDKLRTQVENDSEMEDACDELFHEQIITILKTSFEGEYRKNRCFLYLDRNNSGEQIERTLRILNREVDNRYTYKVIFVIPKSSEPFESDGDRYPFSLETILACLASNTQGVNTEVARNRTAELGWHLRQFRNFELKDYERSYTREFEFPYIVTKTLKERERVARHIDQLIRASKHGVCEDNKHVDEVLKDIKENFEFEWTGEQASANEVEELVSVGFPKIPTLHVGLA